MAGIAFARQPYMSGVVGVDDASDRPSLKLARSLLPFLMINRSLFLFKWSYGLQYNYGLARSVGGSYRYEIQLGSGSHWACCQSLYDTASEIKRATWTVADMYMQMPP